MPPPASKAPPGAGRHGLSATHPTKAINPPAKNTPPIRRTHIFIGRINTLIANQRIPDAKTSFSTPIIDNSHTTARKFLFQNVSKTHPKRIPRKHCNKPTLDSPSSSPFILPKAPTPTATATALIQASRELTAALAPLRFALPVTHLYSPLIYARNLHETYLATYGRSRKRVVFLGMNPGPWGMAQNGVPFGEVASVRDWMGLSGEVDQPTAAHPKRPITGLACTRSEVSGRRLWGLMADRFDTAKAFFAHHFVVNYCPLVFMEESGRNATPDKLPAPQRQPLEAACDQHLRHVIGILKPQRVVGVGKFAEKCARRALGQEKAPLITSVLHPSPASPAANRGWAQAATQQLIKTGVWDT